MKYYLNCNTCTETVRKIKESPNDELAVDLGLTFVVNVCSDYLNVDSCKSLAKKFKYITWKHFFGLFVTEEFVCGYLMPLCDE